MDFVWITHPNLDGRKVRVPAVSLPHHQRAGWVETDPPPPPQPKTTTSEASADAGASSLPKTESPKGRRTKGDEQ
ncbi:MAG TPA: hypothetical protein VFV66_28515 [Nonomuraea sp.]|nr:hypothetical protein [Nonomuraea sp.]